MMLSEAGFATVFKDHDASVKAWQSRKRGKTDYSDGLEQATKEFASFGGYKYDGKALHRDGKQVAALKLRVDGDRLIIDDIEANAKGKGEGTAAIKAIVAAAHAKDMIPALYADSMRGKAHQVRLRSYYTRLGFVANKGDNKLKGVKEEFYYPPQDAVHKNDKAIMTTDNEEGLAHIFKDVRSDALGSEAMRAVKRRGPALHAGSEVPADRAKMKAFYATLGFRDAPAGFAAIFKKDEPVTGFSHIFKDHAASVKAWLSRDHGHKGGGSNLEGKFKAHEDKAKAIVLNSKLGAQYYVAREKYGKDSTQAQTAYKEWDKAKTHLNEKFGYTSQMHSSSSAEIKSMAAKITAEETATKGKSIEALKKIGAKLKGTEKQADIAKHITPEVAGMAKDAGISVEDMVKHIKEGHDEAKAKLSAHHDALAEQTKQDIINHGPDSEFSKAVIAAAKKNGVPADKLGKAVEEGTAAHKEAKIKEQAAAEMKQMEEEAAAAKKKEDQHNAFQGVKGLVKHMNGNLKDAFMVDQIHTAMNAGLSDDHIKAALKEGLAESGASSVQSTAPLKPGKATKPAKVAPPPAEGTDQWHMATVKSAVTKALQNPGETAHEVAANKAIEAAKAHGLTDTSLAAVKAHAKIAINKAKKAMEAANTSPDLKKPAVANKGTFDFESESKAHELADEAIAHAKSLHANDPNKSKFMAGDVNTGEVSAYSAEKDGDTKKASTKVANKVWKELDENEKAAVKSWTGSGYKSLNKGMNSADEAKSLASYQETTKQHLTTALNHELGVEQKLRRNMPQTYMFKQLGLPHDSADAMWNIPDHKLQSLIGKTYTENSFSSSTYDTDSSIILSHTAGVSGILHLAIHAPKETKGLFVDTKSSNSHEKEVLLQRGATYRIKSITKAPKKPSYAGGSPAYKFEVEWIGAHAA